MSVILEMAVDRLLLRSLPGTVNSKYFPDMRIGLPSQLAISVGEAWHSITCMKARMHGMRFFRTT